MGWRMTKRASEKMKIKNTANKTGCVTRRFVGSDIEVPTYRYVRGLSLPALLSMVAWTWICV
jgi:hypothetical protein